LSTNVQKFTKMCNDFITRKSRLKIPDSRPKTKFATEVKEKSEVRRLKTGKDTKKNQPGEKYI